MGVNSPSDYGMQCDMVIRAYDPLMEKFYKDGIILIIDESSLDGLGLKPQDDNDEPFNLSSGFHDRVRRIEYRIHILGSCEKERVP
jgi:hypothetical protein